MNRFLMLELSMRLRPVVLVCFLLCTTAPSIQAGELVIDEEMGLRLSVPDGFIPDPARAQGKIRHAFHRPPAAGQQVGTFILISRLAGVIDRERVDPKELAEKNPQVTVFLENWKDYEVEVFRVPEQVEGVQVLTFNVQVPLVPTAIQVAVIGEASREDEAREVLRAVLGNLDGKTNWLSTATRITLGLEGILRLAVTVGVVVLVTVLVWRAARKRKQGGANPL